MRGKANLVKGLLCVLFLTWPVQAKYGGGSGTAEDPYLINTAEQMNAIGANWDDWDKHFKLMADIDLSSYTGATPPQMEVIKDSFGTSQEKMRR